MFRWIRTSLRSISLTNSTLQKQGLRRVLPVFAVLLGLVALLVLVDACTPLAPFIYSLF